MKKGIKRFHGAINFEGIKKVDAIAGIEEALKQIKEGYTAGSDISDNGNYSFYFWGPSRRRL